MLVMRTTEDPTDPLSELASARQTVRLDHFSLATGPLRLYGVQPWALLGQNATHESHSGFASTVFDAAVMLAAAEPSCDLFRDW